ncbi:MAG: hypothetical protein ABI643_01810 [Candidatus Doudnabacteria bacterium]
MAVLAYLYILVIIPLISDAKNDPFVKFHAKQGLVLLICEIVASFIWTFHVIWIFGSLLQLFFLILIIMGIMNAVNGKTQELPVIGQFASKFNF